MLQGAKVFKQLYVLKDMELANNGIDNYEF